MSSISSLSSTAGTLSMQGMSRPPRPDPAKMAENLFSQIDTSGQGYIQKADLQAALEKVSSSSGTSADDLFTRLDADSDGKVTSEEFSAVLQTLSQSLDQQFDSARMDGAMQAGGMGAAGGMPPPPPPADDTGFTKDELSSQLEEIGSSDSDRSSLISSVIENFDTADTDGDGRVSFKEAMAYQQSLRTGSQTASTDATSGSSGATSTSGDSQLMQQIMRLMQAYGIGGEERGGSTLSVTA